MCCFSWRVCGDVEGMCECVFVFVEIYGVIRLIQGNGFFHKSNLWSPWNKCRSISGAHTQVVVQVCSWWWKIRKFFHRSAPHCVLVDILADKIEITIFNSGICSRVKFDPSQQKKNKNKTRRKVVVVEEDADEDTWANFTAPCKQFRKEFKCAWLTLGFSGHDA